MRTWSVLLILFAVAIAIACALGVLWWVLSAPRLEIKCTMSDVGYGRCTFTNRGSRSGGICGHVQATKDDRAIRAKSDEICSGQVESNEAVTKPFQIQNALLYCIDRRQPGGGCEPKFVRRP